MKSHWAKKHQEKLLAKFGSRAGQINGKPILPITLGRLQQLQGSK